MRGVEQLKKSLMEDFIFCAVTYLLLIIIEKEFLISKSLRLSKKVLPLPEILKLNEITAFNPVISFRQDNLNPITFP